MSVNDGITIVYSMHAILDCMGIVFRAILSVVFVHVQRFFTRIKLNFRNHFSIRPHPPSHSRCLEYAISFSIVALKYARILRHTPHVPFCRYTNIIYVFSASTGISQNYIHFGWLPKSSFWSET